MTVMNLLGLVLAIAVLIFLIFKGCSAIVSSLVAALVAGLLNGFGVWESLSAYYVPGFLNFAGKMFFVFLFATIYGKVIGASGSAHRIAYTFVDIFGKKHALLVIGITTGVLVYGGVSAMVVVFTVLPIAYVLIKEADIPKILLPAAITWGQATFAMSALPGSPQNPNIVPATFFGTTPMAAPVTGIICGILMFVGGWLYLEWQNKRYHEKGIRFDAGSKINLKTDSEVRREDCPGVVKAFAPLVILIVLYLAFSGGVFGSAMDAVTAVNTAMFISIVAVFVLNPGKFNVIMAAFMDGSREWTGPLMNFTCMIAFGAVVQATPGFALVSEWLLNVSGNVYVSALLTVSIMCGITGNGSGGETIAMNALGERWLTMGGNPQALHRIASVASCGFDSLPHCGGITTVYGLCDESIGKGYIHAFFTTTLIPFLCGIVAVVLVSVGIL